MKEEWKIIEEYPNYMISNFGRVKSLNYNKTGEERILKQGQNTQGYSSLTLYNNKRKTHTIHRLVATAFIPNPNNYPCVNHKDENKQNNCVSNLEWCTQEYNINYGTRNERVGKVNSILQKGKPNLALSKPIVQLTKSGLIIGVYDSSMSIERELNIKHNNIIKCCKDKQKSAGGFKWKYLDELKKAG